MNLDMAQSQQVLACLGDRSRFRMVVALAEGDRCVTEIARAVQLSQSCTTRHLQVLLRHSIVSRIRQGKRVCFRLCDDDPAMASLLEWALLHTRHTGVFGPGKLGSGGEPPSSRTNRAKSSDPPAREVAGGSVHQDRPSNGMIPTADRGVPPRDRSNRQQTGYQPPGAEPSTAGAEPSSPQTAEPEPAVPDHPAPV